MDLQPRPDDHEAKMARADLFKLAQYSFKLFKMIHEDQELEGWVQAKITKAADYVASVYHYMEYEMKFSEYGEQLENSDVYSESQKRALQNMLTEAKKNMKKLTAAQAKKLKKKDGKVDEAAKPDFADLDDDGDEEEPMKKAAKDAKKVKEGFPTVDSAKKDHEEREKSKGTGKFDKKDTGKGTQYTRKSSTFTDGGDDSDTKAAKKKAKKVDEKVELYRQDAPTPGQMGTSTPYRTSDKEFRDKLAGEVKAARNQGTFKNTSGKTYTQKTTGGTNGSKIHVHGLKNVSKKPDEDEVSEGGYYDPANDAPQGQNAGAPVKGSQASQDALKAAMAKANGGQQVNPNSLAAANPALAKKYPPGSLPDDRAKQFWLNALTSGKIPQGSPFVASDWGGGQGVQEGMMDTVKKVGKKVAGAVNRAVGHGSDEEMRKDLQRKSGAAVTGKKPDQKVKEASKAKKDYDKDGKIESGKDEYLGSKIAAAKKAGKMEETSKKCNHSAKGKSCPVHGLKECGSMYEASNAFTQSAPYPSFKKKKSVSKEVDKPSQAKPKSKEEEKVNEAKPSAGMSKGAKSALVKKATSGKDIGKPGKSFDKVAAKAGGGEKGKKIAAAAMWKNAANESVDFNQVDEWSVGTDTPRSVGSFWSSDIQRYPEVAAIVKQMKPTDYVEYNAFDQKYPNKASYAQATDGKGDNYYSVAVRYKSNDEFNFINRYNRDNNNLTVGQWLVKAKNKLASAVTGKPEEKVPYDSYRYDQNTGKGSNIISTQEKDFPMRESAELNRMRQLMTRLNG